MLLQMFNADVSLCVVRLGFKDAAICGDSLVAALRGKGPTAAVAVDHACLCESMDVVGRFGFGFDCGAVRCVAGQLFARAPTLTIALSLHHGCPIPNPTLD